MRPLAAAAILSFWATTGTAQEVPVSAVGILDLQSAMLAEPNTLGQDQDRRSREEGFARFAFALGPTYSRVEGLPIRLGALGESAGDNPVRAQAYLIIRTEADNSERLDRVGFTGRIEKFFGGEQAFLVGVEGSSAIQWIETSGVSNLENGLGTFIFQRASTADTGREKARFGLSSHLAGITSTPCRRVEQLRSSKTMMRGERNRWWEWADFSQLQHWCATTVGPGQAPTQLQAGSRPAWLYKGWAGPSKAPPSKLARQTALPPAYRSRSASSRLVSWMSVVTQPSGTRISDSGVWPGE